VRRRNRSRPAIAVGLVLGLLLPSVVSVAAPARPAVAVAAPAALPPGGLVDSAPGFGWTEGEFSVSDDGAAQFDVPLWVPQGRGAVTPGLSLSYDSRSGNGLLGVGWSLGGLPAISWCPRTIAQDGFPDGGHFDGADPLCLGGNRLVPVSPPQLPQRVYRTEQEEFAEITGFGTEDNVPDQFTVQAKDGSILTFGGRPDARMQPYLLRAGDDLAEPALERLPGTPRATTAWAVSQIEDRNGNVATIEYNRTEAGAAGRWWMQLRPQRITYPPNRRVEFGYRDDRPDPIDAFAGGTHTRADRLVDRIEMWGGPQGGGEELLREYRMTYRSDSITGRSLLSTLAECDGAGACKRPLTFDWSLGSYQFEELDAGESEPETVTVTDVDGDGRSDLIIDTRWLRRSNGTGFDASTNSGLPEPGAAVDVDADGRPEVLVDVVDSDPEVGRRWQLYQSNGTGYQEAPGDLGELRPLIVNRPPAYLVDLDGNGLPDFVEAAFGDPEENPWSYRLNTGATGQQRFAPPVETNIQRNVAFGNYVLDTDGDGRAELVNRRIAGPGAASWGLNPLGGPENGSPNLWGTLVHANLGDVNGDGLSDLLLPHPLDATDPGELRVQLNSGNGFGSRLAAPSPPGYVAPEFFPGQQDPGVRVVDFNSDGRDDVLIFRSDGDPEEGAHLYLWTGGGFVRADLDQRIGQYHGPAHGWDNTHVLDIDGDGALDLVNAGTGGRLTVFRRLGGVPDLLTGIGDVSYRDRVEVDYTTLADRDVHIPGSCGYPLSCPTSGGIVVAEHRVASDIAPDLVATWDTYTHTYRAARHDLHGRGWLGFAEHTVTRVATGATTAITFDNVTRDPVTRAYPFANWPERVTYTVIDLPGPQGREFQRTVVNDYDIRHVGGGYTVELAETATTERDRPAGASGWQLLRANTTTTSYDEFGNVDLVESTTANGRADTTALEYRNDQNRWLIGLPLREEVTSCAGAGSCTTRETTHDYDDRGNHILTVVEPDDPALRLTTETSYALSGAVTSVTTTDAADQSRTELFEYDDDQLYPTGTVNPLGHRTETDTHSGLGVPVRTVDPNGVETTMRYDRFGRLRETYHAGGSFERTMHFALGSRQLATTTQSGGGVTTVVVDQLGRQREQWVRSFDGSTAVTFVDYDPLDRGVRRVSRPALPGEPVQYTTTSYDNQGRVISVTAPDGTQVRHEYRDRETHTSDANGVHRHTVASVDGDIESSVEDGLETRYEYGPFGQLSRVVAEDGTIQELEYDRLGRRNRLADPSAGASTWTYTGFGEMATETNGAGETTEHFYDALGRTRRTSSPDGDTVYTWDSAPNGIGKLTNVRSPDGVGINFRYHPDGQLQRQWWRIEEISYEFRYDYDELGRLSTLTYPAIPDLDPTDRLAIRHEYNGNGYLLGITDGTTGDPYWTAVQRDGAGQLTEERAGNQVVTSHAYQPSTGLPETITTTGPGGVGELSRISYEYDPNRNVTRRHDLVNRRDERFGYDPLNRLVDWHTEVPEPGYLAVAASYAYDQVGNLTAETFQRDGEPEQQVVYGYGEDGAPPHGLSSRNGQRYGYDAAGRQTSGPQRTVAYNSRGLPTALTWSTQHQEPRNTTFAYDADGTRALKRDGDQTVVYAGDGLFARYTPAGTGATEIHNLHSIMVEGRVVAQVNRAQAVAGGPVILVRQRYLHADAQGSTVAVTNSAGQQVGGPGSHLGELYYDPFGRRIDAAYQPRGHQRHSSPREGYTGHEHDDEYGLINMIGRIYDPEARRFLTPDPLATDPLSSQSHNRYTYVRNNPATLTDPTGQMPKSYGHWLAPIHPHSFYPGSPVTFHTSPVIGGGLFWKPNSTASESESADDDRSASSRTYEQQAQFQGSVETLEAVVYSGVLADDHLENQILAATEAILDSGLAGASGEEVIEVRGKPLAVLAAEAAFWNSLAALEWVMTKAVQAAEYGSMVVGGIGLVRAGAGLAAGRLAVRRAAGRAAQELPDVVPDVYVGALRRWTVKAGVNSRGITGKIRSEVKAWARKYGTMDGPPTTGAVHAGHQYGGSHVFTLPGQTTKVGAQTARGNLAQAADEARAAAARRSWNAAHPNGPHLPVRPLGSR
jgi:RHS repeat-associated protein